MTSNDPSRQMNIHFRFIDLNIYEMDEFAIYVPNYFMQAIYYSEKLLYLVDTLLT